MKIYLLQILNAPHINTKYFFLNYVYLIVVKHFGLLWRHQIIWCIIHILIGVFITDKNVIDKDYIGSLKSICMHCNFTKADYMLDGLLERCRY